LSVSGWCMLALKSASAAGIAGSKEAYPKFRRLMDATLGARTGGWYDARGEGRLVSIQTGTAMHAVAMLCRLLLGEHGTPALLQGADIQVQRLPDWHSRNTYHICYCTLSLFQIGEPTWKTWNSHVSKMLVENQRKDGDAAGSWDPNGNDWGVGRTYATTLCCLSLEVYYRYAALYR